MTKKTHPGLEGSDLLIGEGIGLGDNRDQVDLGVQALHDLDVQGLQRVAGGLDEEHAGMDPVVHDVHAVHFVLGIKVSIETLLNIINNGPPRLVVVNKVTKARGVNDGQAQTHASLLDIGANGLNSNRLRDDVKAGLLALLRGVERSVEEGVDKSRFSKAGFTW